MLHVSRVVALHNHARPSAGKQQRMMNACNRVQEAVAPLWPAPLPLWTAHNPACTRGGCNALHCDSKRCEQSFTGGACNMTCSSNAEECSQSCTGGNCQMICSPGVKQCNQISPFGNCVVQCDADKCSLTCPGGACTVIKSSPTPITTITTMVMATTKSSGAGFKALVAWCLTFALFFFFLVKNR